MKILLSRSSDQHNGLTHSRADISALAQAKAANFCGQQIVLQELGRSIGDYARQILRVR